MTAQGEVLVERYDDPQIGYRHLEQVVAATLLTIDDHPPALPDRWSTLMTQVSDAAQAEYDKLIHDPAFLDYFRSATPIGEIEKLPLGSRPSRRGAQKSPGGCRMQGAQGLLG
ncbi:MAG: phosphoenolpyruvate carboxylase [Phycisphaeraceae bacterium]|nr:phosphoenolpyruvate carboxylase [Phycisphaeraceae bacterium]